MNLKNDNLNSVFCFSRLGRKIEKQNLLLYRWSHKKAEKRAISVSPAVARIKMLYNINKLKYELKQDDDDNNIFSIEEKERQKLEDFEENIESKKEYINKLEEKEEKKNEKLKQNKSEYITPKYYFTKKKENKNKLEPSCTKYNPKYDAIMKRSPSSPSWKSMQGRKYPIQIDNSDFYLKQKLIQENMAGKSFINFRKQRKRKGMLKKDENKKNNIINISNISKNKSLINKKKDLYNNKRNKSSLIISKNTSKLEKEYKESTPSKNSDIQKNLENEILSTENSKDSFDLFKQIYTSKIKKKKKKKIEYEKYSKKIKSIDFNQVISRESLDQIQSKQTAFIPYLFPNFSQVRERPIMMVVYDQKKRNRSNKRKSDLENVTFDNVNYEQIYKSKVKTPNFELMKSRPSDENDAFPTHMRGVFDKNTCFKVSSESLKSTNYGKRDFMMPLSSFWSNHSFNKYVNLKMIKSQSHLNKAYFDNEYLDPRTKRLMKIYNKNYKRLMEEKTKYSPLEKEISIAINKHQNKTINDIIKDLKSKKEY